MPTWDERDFRPGDDWSLEYLYQLVPDAYEFDLLEDARIHRRLGDERYLRQLDLFALVDDLVDSAEVDRIDLADGPALPAADESEDDRPVSPPSLTQAQFVVERLLGGEVVHDRHE